MILVDSNIPMYLVGAPHRNKDRAAQLVESLVTRGEKLVSDAEVLQEILHRYHGIRRTDAIEPAFACLLGIVDEVFPVTLADVKAAHDVMRRSSHLSARDAVHVAVMKHHGVHRVLSFDSGFDEVSGLSRLS